MPSDISKQLGHLLMSYTGKETDRVRTAIALLSKDDIQKMEHFINRANQDYRDVLWWAEIQEEEERQKAALRGMTVNERLYHLNLFSAWDTAISRRDRASASAILQKCEIPNSDIDKILDAEIKNGA